MKGIDVSKYNQIVPWKKLASLGYEFVMIRAGYGKKKNQVDPFFETSYYGAGKAGLKRGVYWFSYAVSVADAIAEAKLLLETLNSRELEVSVAFDFEYDSINYAAREGVAITPELCCKITSAFMSYVKANSNYNVMLYTNPDMISRYYNGFEKNYPLWLAYWTDNEDKAKSYEYSIWQRGTVTVDGKVFDDNTTSKEFDESLNEYGDVNGKWYELPANWCIEHKIMIGYGDKQFHGDDVVTRGMLAQALYNLTNKK